jgi:hypothetical protein
MERRLQLLLDQHRYAMVEREARASGRSVAAVIREAIDLRFNDGGSERAAAASLLLDLTREPVGVEPDWALTKAELEAAGEIVP